jgi:hypothetical protein
MFARNILRFDKYIARYAQELFWCSRQVSFISVGTFRQITLIYQIYVINNINLHVNLFSGFKVLYTYR